MMALVFMSNMSIFKILYKIFVEFVWLDRQSYKSGTKFLNAY